MADVQYISDTNGTPIGVFVPIHLWEEIESEKETAYLLRSENMRTRLLDSLERNDGVSLENVKETLGI